MGLIKISKAHTFLVGLMIMAILLCCSSQAQASEQGYDGDYIYTVTDGKAEIMSYIGTGGVVTIPSTLGGYPVISIGAYAFCRCKGLTSIIIPQGVTSIGDGAFLDCQGLTSVSLPQGLTSIGAYAFCRCKGLTSIIIPQGVTSIGDGAFLDCQGLTSVNLQQGLTSIGHDAFCGCKGLTSIIIPQGVTSIGAQTFLNCISLTSVSLPQGLTSIGRSAFCDCIGLTSIIIPQGVTSIGSQAFCDCIGLTSIIIPQELTSMGDEAFCGCEGLTSVIISQGVTIIGHHAFRGCTSLTTIKFNSATTGIDDTEYTIPVKTKIIGYDPSTAKDYATKYNRTFEVIGTTNTLESIAITTPAAKQSFIIGEELDISGLVVTGTYSDGSTKAEIITDANITGFNSSEAITDQVLTITVGAKTTTYKVQIVAAPITADYTYTVTDGQATITKYTGAGGAVTIPSTLGGYPVTSIGDYAFLGYRGITSIDIPQGIVSIGFCSFFNLFGLTTISLPQSLTSIGYDAFTYCYDLKAIIVATDNLNYTSIDGVLYNKARTSLIACPDSLTSISLPQSLTNIGQSAFAGCKGLTSISLPKGITNIGDDAFAGCYSLKAFIVASDNLNYTSIDGVLYNKAGTSLIACPGGLTSISLPQGLTSIGDYAFHSCIGLTSISLPQGLTSIGENAFLGCTGLTTILIPQGVTSIGFGAFQNCTGLKTLSLPQGVTSIGSYAFVRCTGLTSIIFNSATTTIADDTNTIPATTKIIGYNPSTAKDYATKYDRTFEVISTSNTFTATSIVQIGTNPNDGDSAGIFVGLKDIRDTQGNVVSNAKLASYQIEIVYNHNLATILNIVDEAHLGQFAQNNETIMDRASVTDSVHQGTGNFDKLFFIPLALTGNSTSSANVLIKFVSLSDSNANPINIPDVALTFQRGKILNEANHEDLSIVDAISGLQYLANIVDAGTDTGKVNVINMASIVLPETGATRIKPSVKDVIALMQNLVGLRDDTFQLNSH